MNQLLPCVLCVFVCLCGCVGVCVCVCEHASLSVWLSLSKALFYSSPSNLAQVRSDSLLKIVRCSVMRARDQMKMVPECTWRIPLSRHIMKLMIKYSYFKQFNFTKVGHFFWLTLYIGDIWIKISTLNFRIYFMVFLIVCTSDIDVDFSCFFVKVYLFVNG